jgi:2-keto-4-pentenoate hydratase/2-oxohepta-3-ene-1,7-dioic acid hydratase in catechol pathway
MELLNGLEARRVFCIGCNYDAHIKEMGSRDSDKCVVFMKPPTSLVPVGHPVAIPRGRGAVHHELELVVAIGQGGRDIAAADARDHVGGIALGLDMTLREVQNRIKQNGHPWELCKAFDYSAPLGEVVPLLPEHDLAAIEMRCAVNGELRQEGNTRDMLFPVERLVEILSGTWELLPGDLIYTGTPPGVGPVEAGDTVTVESPQVGRFTWRIA